MLVVVVEGVFSALDLDGAAGADRFGAVTFPASTGFGEPPTSGVSLACGVVLPPVLPHGKVYETEDFGELGYLGHLDHLGLSAPCRF